MRRSISRSPADLPNPHLRASRACLIVDRSTSTVISHSNNTPLVTHASSSNLSKKSPPEIHAEARALSLLAASPSLSASGTTAYITFPPCDSCFHLLCAAGVKRVVYRNALRSVDTKVLAKEFGIELVEKGTDGAVGSGAAEAQVPEGGKVVEGREWDEWVRSKAGEEWERIGETGAVTKDRNAGFYAEHARRSFELTQAVEAEGVSSEPKVGGKGEAKGPGKIVVAAAAVVLTEVAEFPSKRTLEGGGGEGEPEAKLARTEEAEAEP